MVSVRLGFAALGVITCGWWLVGCSGGDDGEKVAMGGGGNANAGASGAGKGGSSAGKGSTGGNGGGAGDATLTCAPPAGSADERCTCPPCPEWRSVPLPSDSSFDQLFVTRAGRVFVNWDRTYYADTLDGTWLPTGVRVTLLHEDRQGRLIATLSGALAISEDAGETWTPLASSPSTTDAWLTPQGIYAGSSAVKRSTDNGATWTTIGAHQQGLSALPDGTLFGLEMYYHPGQNRWIDLRPVRGNIDDFWSSNFTTESGAVLRGGDAGLILSTDFGESWQDSWTQEPEALAANTSSVVAARLENSGIHVHRAGGWAHIGPTKTGGSRGHGVLPDGRVVALGNYKDPSNPVVFEPTTLLVTTEPVTAEPILGPKYPPTCTDGALSGTEELVDCGGECAPCKNWHVLPQAPDAFTYWVLSSGTLLAADSSALYRSTDNGLTWSDPNLESKPYSMAGAPDGTVYMTTDSGSLLWASKNDGVTFERVREEPISVAAWDLTVTASGTLISHNQGSVGRSKDRGVTWEKLVTPGGERPFALATGELFLSGGVQLHRSLDDGDTWESLTPSVSGMFIKLGQASILGVSKAGTANESLSISVDAGETWLTVTRPEPRDDSWRLLDTTAGYLYAGTHSYLSDDGTTWQQVDDSGSYDAHPLLQLPNGWILGADINRVARLARDPAEW